MVPCHERMYTAGEPFTLMLFVLPSAQQDQDPPTDCLVAAFIFISSVKLRATMVDGLLEMMMSWQHLF